MAIIPATRYPSQIITTDPDYPRGKARNVSAQGAGDGTPFEENGLNDIWGFLQALLAAGAVTPSGAPDRVGASQYLQAIKNLAITVEGGTKTLTGTLTIGGNSVTISLGLQVNGALGVADGIVAAGGMLIDNIISSGNVQMQQALIANRLTLSGAGHIKKRTVVVADNDATYGINDGDIFIIRGITSGHVYSLSSSGATDGVEVEFISEQNFACQIDPNTTPGGLSYGIRKASLNPYGRRFVFYDGAWTLSNTAWEDIGS